MCWNLRCLNTIGQQLRTRFVLVWRCWRDFWTVRPTSQVLNFHLECWNGFTGEQVHQLGKIRTRTRTLLVFLQIVQLFQTLLTLETELFHCVILNVGAHIQVGFQWICDVQKVTDISCRDFRMLIGKPLRLDRKKRNLNFKPNSTIAGCLNPQQWNNLQNLN